MRPPALRRIALAAATIVVFAGIELSLRVGEDVDLPGPPPEVLALNPDIVADPLTMWRAGPPWNSEQDANVRESLFQILVIGEDDALGTHLQDPANQSWPGVLRQVLDRTVGQRVVDVDLAAAQGFTAAQGAALLDRVLEARQPKIVILAFGSANEFTSPLLGRSDAEWLAAIAKRDRSASRVFDLIRDAIELPETPSEPPASSVRLDVASYERALERMIATIRAAGACPAILEPARRSPRDAPSRDDSIAALYRLAACRVAGVYGVPLIRVADALAVDRGPFRATSRHLSARGAQIVAREVARSIAMDSSFLLSIQRWLESHASDPRADLLAGSIGLLRWVHREGPGARPPQAVRDLLQRAYEHGDPETRLAACARLAIAQHEAYSLEASLAAASACTEIDARSSLAVRTRATVQMLLGRVDDARLALETNVPDDPALDSLLLGISLVTTDATAADAAFARSAAFDPALTVADLWRAKSRSIAGDAAGAALYCGIARTALFCHGSGGGFEIPIRDDAKIAAFLNDDTTLFGDQQRDALPRLLFGLFAEAPTRRRDAAARIDRLAAFRQGGLEAEANVELEAARAACAGADADELMRLANLALSIGVRDLARELANRAYTADASPDALFTLAVAEHDSNAPERATGLLEEYLKLRPRDPRALYYLARARLDAGDAGGAIDAAKLALEAWPNHRELLDVLAEAEALREKD